MIFDRRIFIRTLISIVLTWAGAAAGRAGTAVAATAVDGALIYAQHCVICHGDKGDGDTRVRRGLSAPPTNFTTARSRTALTRGRMLRSVAEGRPGTAMMAFGSRLSQAEVAAVVDYIRATFMTGKANAALPPKIAEGEQLYVRHCAVCHGDEGSGAVWTQSSLNPPPRNFTAALRDELTRERMITSVTYGRPGTAMMSFRKRLSAEQIATVVDYIRASFLGKAVKPPDHPHIAQADMSLPFPDGLHGDARKGKRFFDNNCFTCHGKHGNGKGPRSSFINPKPRNFLSIESRIRLNRPTLFTAVRDGVRGSVMPSWGKVLSDQQIADVAEYVFTAFVHPEDEGDQPAADKKKLNP
jgi:cbb3-type cytochrome c oxidase subunit III